MKSKSVLWIVIIIAVLAIAGGAYAYYSAVYVPAQETAEDEPVQSTTVRRGNIVISATGAGTVIPTTETELAFGAGGVLSELLVQVGDDVLAGDVLARLDDTDAQQALANTELQLLQATMQMDGTATETGVSYNDISVEQARINLEKVQSDLDSLLNWEADADEIAIAESNLEAAQAGYNAARGQEASAGYSIDVGRINLEQAQRDLATAQENYDDAWDEARDWETFYSDPICDPGEPEPCTGQTWAERIERDRESTDNALTKAQDNLAIAQANFNSTVAGTSTSNSTNAQSNVLSAEVALESAKTGPTDDEIEAAEIAVRQAELSLQQALLGRESDALSLAQAQLNLEAAQATLDDVVLTAPMDGTVMVVNASVGENVNAGFISLADLEQPLVEVFLDETDLDKIGLDFEVEVIFDALPDDIFTGHVVQVDPQLSNVSGVSAVRAIVQLDADSFAKPQTLPVGLNASVDVIGGRADNALLVPVEALRELSPGEYAVFVLEDGEPQLRFVEVGLMDFTFAEILSGLEAGETVTTGIVETG
jgi:multidrug efflux pump subunit AcrA (membrane-fusion protein)